jgi:hypothetical protein
VDPIFNNLIKVAMENATFWENMKTLEQSASTIEGNYNSFVSAASKFNKNFTYQYPGQSHGEIHAEIPEEIPGQCPVGGQSERSTAQPYQHCPRNQKAGSRSNNNLDHWHSGSKPNNNFNHWHLGQNHAEISAEIHGQPYVGSHLGRPTVSRNQHWPRSQREPKSKNRPRSYEHHFAFMVTTVDSKVDSNSDPPGDDDDETYFIPGQPVETPAADNE